MPFDGTDVTPSLRRAMLIDALRGEMPKGFRWDFSEWYFGGSCGAVGCACGVAKAIGLVEGLFGTGKRPSTIVGAAVGLDARTAQRIFRPGKRSIRKTYGVSNYAEVTPAMVADALERVGEGRQ